MSNFGGPPQPPGPYGPPGPQHPGVPQQGAWPQQPGYGAPGGYAPGQPQQGWGPGMQPQAGFPQQAGAWGPAAAQRPVASVGLFGAIPCPQCGAPTTSHAGSGSHTARVAGGLVGILLYQAFASKRYCGQHGLIESHMFPPAHQSIITLRKVAMVGGALALFAVCVALIIAVNAL